MKTALTGFKQSYQVRGMAVWNEQAHRKLQTHWPVQMTHQWLNQHTQPQVKPAMPDKRKQKMHPG